MGEGTGAPLEELPEKASESLDKIEKNLDTILTLTKRQFSCLIALGFAAGCCGWVMGHEGSEKAARSARLEGQEALNKALEEKSELTQQAIDLKAQLGKDELLNGALSNQVAALIKDRDNRRQLEETTERDPPLLQLKKHEFLRKAESMEDSPAQTQLRRESEDKLIIDWSCTFEGTIGSKTSKNRGLKVRFDDSGFYSNCYLSDPKQVEGFELTDLGVPLRITKGTIEHLNVGYMQMHKCQIVR
jgi:hypothetical protein